MLPSPLAFDHVVVMARMDGQELYLDPTLTFQGGRLDDSPSRYYGRTLVIREGAPGLTEIPEPSIPQPTTRIHEVFDATAGTDTVVAYSAETVYRASDADWFRSQLAQTNAERLQTDYLNYLDQFTVTESYTIPDMWTPDRSQAEGALQMTVHPYELYNYVDKPQTLRRTMPLALPYPLLVEHRIEVLLPEPWPVNNDEVAIQNTAFSYTSQVRYSADGMRLELTYRLQTFKDFVSPGELRRYLADLDRVDKDLGYQLTMGGEEAPSKPRPWGGVAAAAVVILALVVRNALARGPLGARRRTLPR
jgi:hypothetical protein